MNLLGSESSPQLEDLLHEGLAQLGLDLSPDQIGRIYGYHQYLLEVNETHNLTAHRDARDSLVKNVLNALGPWRQVFPTRKSADIGSGGGLPGIPLAIALNMEHLTLIESKKKKCNFLEEACKRFAPKVRVICDDANAVKTHFEQIICCGFGTLDKFQQVTTKMRKKDTRLLAYKGRRATVIDEISKCRPKFREWEVIPFFVPFQEEGTERHLCIWQK